MPRCESSGEPSHVETTDCPRTFYWVSDTFVRIPDELIFYTGWHTRSCHMIIFKERISLVRQKVGVSECCKWGITTDHNITFHGVPMIYMVLIHCQQCLHCMYPSVCHVPLCMPRTPLYVTYPSMSCTPLYVTYPSVCQVPLCMSCTSCQ